MNGFTISSKHWQGKRALLAYLWFFSILSCSNVTNSSDIKQVHFMILVKPIKIKPLFIYSQRNGRSRAGILHSTTRWKRKKRNIIYYSCLSSKNYSPFTNFFFPFYGGQLKEWGGNEIVFSFFFCLKLWFRAIKNSQRKRNEELWKFKNPKFSLKGLQDC